MENDIPPDEQYVFTSIRYDEAMKKDARNPTCCQYSHAKDPKAKNAYLLQYHYDRLADAAGHMGWYDVQKRFRKSPSNFTERVHDAVLMHKNTTGEKGPFKLRIRLRLNGKMQFNVESIFDKKTPLLFPPTLHLSYQQQYPAGTSQPIFKVVLDALPTRHSLWTRDKTHMRTMYSYARQCAGIQSFQDAKEVLLFNKDGDVMDGSITTPYFWRDDQWVTPTLANGTQQGTTRRYALSNELCGQASVSVDSLRHGEVIWLSNSVKGFFTARYVCTAGRCSPPSYRSSSSSASSDQCTIVSDDADKDSQKGMKAML